jgi:tetratricopeptide (TPR) repeat protein
MTEETGSTQPIQPVKKDDTQPVPPIKPPSRWRSLLIGILGVLIILGLAGYSAYFAGIGDRLDAERAIVSRQVTEQFQFALVDIEFGRYESARQRLEYIISKDPSYPGASEKLTEVLVLSSIPTPTLAPTLTSTPDFSGAESAYGRAQQLILAQDWPGALGALDTIRKLDSTYKTAQVDGMYYFALRNYGVAQITNGNLEGGIYELTLAERFGPLDRTAEGLREGSRMYITGASFWGLDWSQAVGYFTEVGLGWPSLWDGTLRASERLFEAAMRYGDELFAQQQYCEALAQYQTASSVGNLTEPSASQAAKAQLECYPATATIGVVITATTDPNTVPTATTEVIVPTDTTEPLPTDIPTDIPTP